MIARFKDLCLDALDPPALGAFWARTLGGDVVDLGDGDVRVDGRPGRPGPESIWVNRVAEPRAAKTRVHLDLRLDRPDPAALVAAGARLVREPDDEAPWWVLADPEGNEFCAFASRPGRAAGPFELVVDARDAVAQATWWAEVVGGRVDHGHGGVTSVVGGAGFPWDHWVFAPVPEPRTVKNRMHWDVDLTGPDCAALVAAGASLLREPDDDIGWWILADPEGNEFCAFAPGH
ncbi:VOC family protein [Micromonospora sp. WMMD882]|uniref:VOC family protein n=1 Tax=Micromonospora sp. WMMD882 TaxID=3015151 RepID=UPI00248C66CD|nr:VOC family protein [Micromonospora sp. WMMD882]WBB80248.1 VOC family protein [Micromonospora sp. WMMD882]